MCHCTAIITRSGVNRVAFWYTRCQRLRTEVDCRKNLPVKKLQRLQGRLLDNDRLAFMITASSLNVHSISQLITENNLL